MKKTIIISIACVIAAAIALTIASAAGGAAEEPEEIQVIEITQQVQASQDNRDVEMLARLLWGEARGVSSDAEKAAVAWCVLNRVDAPEFPDTIAEVILQAKQFEGYTDTLPIDDHLQLIAADVLSRWKNEKTAGATGRTLPKEYLYFWGDGERNHFTKEWQGTEEWGWELPSPYNTTEAAQ
ncbi:MAG: cell wall hydrolase [Ruminococcus sp.]